MRLATGDTFAGFHILRLLGSGGMGEVYLVDHPRLPRQEALKILSAAVTADTEFRERFNREADLVAELWHPHIVAVHDRGEFSGQLWITMDYVEGTDAAALVRDQFPSGVAPQFAAEIVSAVADALDYAHERGFLHRDVKPANILLSDTDPEARRRRILLSDFGIARKMDDVGGLTATNMTVGSIAYAAPEQLMGQTLDGRADQYALAATAFQLLTGRPPFDNSNPAVVISCHLSAPRPKMGEQRPDLSGLDAVITRGMATEPAERFSSCHEFSEALAAAVSGGPAVDHATMVRPAADAAFAAQATQLAPVSPASNAPVEATRQADAAPTARSPRSRRGWMIAAAIGVVVVVAGTVLTVQLTRSPSGDTAQAPTGGQPPSTGLSASAADGLLLDAAQAGKITGQNLTISSTSNQQLDASADVNPTQCNGAIYPAEGSVYGPTGFTALRQSLQATPTNAAYHVVDQSVALLPSPEAARQFQADSKVKWQECAGQPVKVSYPDGTSSTATLSDVGSYDVLIVQGRQIATPAASDLACEHTMGVWSNVVAETVVCGEGDVETQSQQIVDAILSNAEKKA